MIDWSTCPAVERDPDRVSGAWVFRGTRVPVAALFENLEDGAQVSEFVEWFPGVPLVQVRAVLERVEVERVISVPPVATIRERTGLSQAKFAALLGVSVRTLQEWEQGR